MIDKRFHKGIELKNNLLYFKGINHLPHITDIIHGYNTILEENEQLKSRIQYLERKIQRERASAMKQHEKWEKELME